MPGLRLTGAVERGPFRLDVDVTVARGELLVVLGPNGSGKSTLLGTVAGTHALSSGTLTLDGQLWDDGHRAVTSRERRIGSVTASGDLFPHLDALANVAFGQRARGARGGRVLERARAELGRAGVEHLAGRRPSELSSGQHQRVALARAFATDPAVLLLDEPLSAIDVDGRHAVRALISERVRETNVPTLLVTHDPVDALSLADRLLVLEGGRISQVGSPQEVLTRPRSTFAAGVVGLNLWTGRSEGEQVRVGAVPVVTAQAPPSTALLHVAFAPAAVSLWRTRPEGSPRNSWDVVVDGVEAVGATARVRLHLVMEPDLTLVADLTLSAVRELGVEPGARLVATVKATDVRGYG